VTLLYPSARVSVLRNGEGFGVVAVAVAYANTGNAAIVAGIHGQDGDWSVSSPFSVLPQLGGHSEETRQVRFVFVAASVRTSFQLFGLYVDPWMR
jgi:hypothetical protein